MFYTFDPLAAQAIGLPVNLIHIGLISAITLTIIASMQVVGVVLVVSLLIGTEITAYLLVKELHQMMGFGSILGIFSSVAGLYLSYYQNVPSGAAIVLVVSGLFVLTLLAVESFPRNFDATGCSASFYQYRAKVKTFDQAIMFGFEVVERVWS